MGGIIGLINIVGGSNWVYSSWPGYAIIMSGVWRLVIDDF